MPAVEKNPKRTRGYRAITALLNFGTWCTMTAKAALAAHEYRVVSRCVGARIQAEGLVRGRDDRRAKQIAAEELMWYRSLPSKPPLHFEITVPSEIDPWQAAADASMEN